MAIAFVSEKLLIIEAENPEKQDNFFQNIQKQVGIRLFSSCHILWVLKQLLKVIDNA